MPVVDPIQVPNYQSRAGQYIAQGMADIGQAYFDNLRRRRETFNNLYAVTEQDMLFDEHDEFQDQKLNEFIDKWSKTYKENKGRPTWTQLREMNREKSALGAWQKDLLAKQQLAKEAYSIILDPKRGGDYDYNEFLDRYSKFKETTEMPEDGFLVLNGLNPVEFITGLPRPGNAEIKPEITVQNNQRVIREKKKWDYTPEQKQVYYSGQLLNNARALKGVEDAFMNLDRKTQEYYYNKALSSTGIIAPGSEKQEDNAIMLYYNDEVNRLIRDEEYTDKISVKNLQQGRAAGEQKPKPGDYQPMGEKTVEGKRVNFTVKGSGSLKSESVDNPSYGVYNSNKLLAIPKVATVQVEEFGDLVRRNIKDAEILIMDTYDGPDMNIYTEKGNRKAGTYHVLKKGDPVSKDDYRHIDPVYIQTKPVVRSEYYTGSNEYGVDYSVLTPEMADELQIRRSDYDQFFLEADNVQLQNRQAAPEKATSGASMITSPPKKGLSGEDKEAYDWASSNPDDPRAKTIIDKLKREGKL